MRCTHANRHRLDHTYAAMTCFNNDFTLKPVQENAEISRDELVTRWLEGNNMTVKKETSPTSKIEYKKKPRKVNIDAHMTVNIFRADLIVDQENINFMALSKSQLRHEKPQDSTDESHGEYPTEVYSSLTTRENTVESTATKISDSSLDKKDKLQPKKRWLREACLEQQHSKTIFKSQLTGNTPSNATLEKFTVTSSPSSERFKRRDDFRGTANPRKEIRKNQSSHKENESRATGPIACAKTHEAIRLNSQLEDDKRWIAALALLELYRSQ